MASSDMQNEAPLKYGNGQPDSHTGHRDQARFSISGLSLPILAAGHNGTFDASLGPTTTGSMPQTFPSSGCHHFATYGVLVRKRNQKHSVALAWTASASENVSGYYV